MGRPREQTIMLTGQVGYNRTTTPDWRLPADRLVTAVNVWMGSPAGIAERRYGTTSIDMPTGVTQPIDLLAIAEKSSGAMVTKILLCDEDERYWYLSDGVLTAATWTTLTISTEIQGFYGSALPDQHAYVNSKAFMPVPTTSHSTATTNIVLASGAVRRVGLTPPAAAPTVADIGSGSYASDVRYYRVRWKEQSSGSTTRRSEASTASAPFTPSGSGLVARITAPTTTTAVADGATHWEVEGSTDGTTFYVIATVDIGTTTYDDSAAVSTYSSGTLSADVGEYAQPAPCVTVATDGSYLLYAGNETYPNRVYYSLPKGTRDVGDEEAFPPDHYFDIDAEDNDRITTFAGPVGDVLLVFKHKSMFRLVKTGNATAPYEPVKIADIGCPGPRYISEGPIPGGADGEAAYWANREGAWMCANGAVAKISTDIVSAGGTDESTWALGGYRVVYYEGRQSMLFGNYVYSLATGGWSYLSAASNPALTQIVTRTSDAYSGRLIRTGTLTIGSPAGYLPGLYVFDDFMNPTTATSDVGVLAVTGLLQFPTLMPFGHGVRYVVSRCRVWGQMLGNTYPASYERTGISSGRLTVCRVSSTLPFSGGADSLHDTLGTVTLTGEDAPRTVVPSNLGVGPTEYLGLVLMDDTTQLPWRINALELSFLPAEPLV